MKNLDLTLGTRLAGLHSAINLVTSRYEDLHSRMNKLESAGIIYGFPTYRAGRLILVHPGYGEQEDIGTDSEAIKTVLEKVNRGQQYQQLLEEAARINRDLDRCSYFVQQAIISLKPYLPLDAQ